MIPKLYSRPGWVDQPLWELAQRVAKSNRLGLVERQHFLCRLGIIHLDPEKLRVTKVRSGAARKPPSNGALKDRLVSPVKS